MQKQVWGFLFSLILLVGGAAAVEVVDFDAYPATGAAPLDVRFTDHSNIPNIKYWYWEFGDGTSCYKQHPTHTYAEPGIYDVTLTVYTADNEYHHKKIGMVEVSGGKPAATPTAEPTFTASGLHGGVASSSSWPKYGGNIQNSGHILNPTSEYSTDGTVEWIYESEVVIIENGLVITDNGDICGFGYDVVADWGDPSQTGIFCIDKDTGSQKWLCDLDMQNYYVSSLVAVDGLVSISCTFYDPDTWESDNYILFFDSDTGMRDDAWCIDDDAWDYLETTPVTVDSSGYYYYGYNYIMFKLGDGVVEWNETVYPYPELYDVGIGNPAAIDADGNIVIDDSYAIICLDSDTGNPIWIEDWGITTGLAIGDSGTIYGGTMGGAVFAFNADGSLKWYNDDVGVNFYGRHVGIFELMKLPALDYEENIYLTGQSEYYVPPPLMGLSTNDDLVSSQDIPYENESGLYKYSSSGVLEWIYPIIIPEDQIPEEGAAGTIDMSSPVVGSDGTIYFWVDIHEEWITGFGDEQQGVGVYGVDDKYYLYAINPDGTLKWEYEFPYAPVADIAIGGDGTVYVGTEGDWETHFGRIYAFGAESQTCADNCFDGTWVSPDPHPRYPLWENITTVQPQAIDTETAFFMGQLNWDGDPIPIWFEYGTASNSYGYCSPHVNVSGGTQLGNSSYYTYNFTYRQRDFPLYAGGWFYIRAACEYGYGEEMRFCLNSTDAHPVPTYGNNTDLFIFSYRNGTTMASDIVEAVWSPYYLIMGGFFFGLVISAIFANMAMKQNSVVIPIMVALFCGSLIWTLFPPEFVQGAQAFYIIALAGIVYWVITKRA